MAKKIKHAKKFDDLPTPRHTAVLDEIENEKQTDRAVAIIGAAYVDLVLREAITDRLLPDDKLMELLFENRGPLQEFGSRIQIALALGVYGRAFYEDLRCIKDIRNAFAHSAEALDFNNQDVSGSCNRLWFPKRISVRNRPKPASPRALYIRAIELLTDLLHENLMRRKNGMPDAPLIMAPGPLVPSTTKK